MSNAGLGLLGTLGIVGAGVLVKKKIDGLHNQIRLLISRIASLENENSELIRTLNNKDLEITQKNREIAQKDKQIKELVDELHRTKNKQEEKL